MDIKTLKNHIENVSEALIFFNQILNQEFDIINHQNDEKRNLVEKQELRNLLKQEVWPAAVSEDLLCSENLDDDKLARAADICEKILRTETQATKILDFGCGEGHTTYLMATLSDAEVVLGFDIESHEWNFGQSENLIFSQNFEKVKSFGPFDSILVHDVLDHCHDPEETLQSIKQLKSQEGKIYLRCHPWTSRHANHLYRQVNKAYLHLIFSEDELYSMGVTPNYCFKNNDPIDYYEKLFKKHNLKILSKNTVKQPFELFFLTRPSILKRMKNNLELTGKLPIELLEVQFVDYTLF